MNFKELSNEELINIYGLLIKEMKERNIIRTRNIVGEIGEHIVIEYFNKTKGLPKLQAAPISSKSIDAISNMGDRYTIKTTTNKTTGVFYGLNSFNSNEIEKNKLFEYVLIVMLNKEYKVDEILELDWETFLKHKHWHSRMNAWNLILSEKLRKDCRVIYKNEINDLL